jgi:DNA replication and repair protein RecF
LSKPLGKATFKRVISGLAAGRAVHLNQLRLAHFRNLAPTEIETPPEGAVLEGANGQGKTNFLESIHLLARFRSFRGTPFSDAIAFDSDHFRVEGSVVREDGSARTVAVASNGVARRIALDGRGVALSGAMGAVVAVLVAPEDVALVAGSPSWRRAYLDGILDVVSRRYRRASREYDRALRQRNEALRSDAPEAVLATWDQSLVTSGVALVVERAGLVARLAQRFAEVAGGIAGADEGTEYGMAYEPSVPVTGAWSSDEESVAEVWRRALARDRAPDRARGWTGVGPHRDGLALALRGRPLARFGSQGEQRTAAIALRLLEAEALEDGTGSRPILLLDDVFSEIDEERGLRLLERLDDGARRQRFVTTPRPVPWIDGGLPRWRVSCGRVEK